MPMIPLKLELRNFLCYCEPDVLDFSGLHVVCLSGENGAGKSALLDALTWALWGKSRAKSDDELIHHGRAEMRVTFTFQLGNQVYQITRQRQAGKLTRTGAKAAGHTILDLQVEHNGEWRTLGEGNISETQAKINQLLRLDYETFIHSAFLMQGRADAFTLKPPSERKQVLADILGLDQWAEYDHRAKARLDTIDLELSYIARSLIDIENELARRPEFEAELEAAQKDIIRLSAERAEAEAAEREAALRRQALESLQRQCADLTERLEAAERELAGLNRQLEGYRTRLAEYERTIAQRDAIEQGYQRLVAARQRDEDLRELEKSYNEMTKHRFQLEAAIQRAEDSLKQEAHYLSTQLAKEEKKAALDGLLKQLSDTEAEVNRLSAAEAQREALRAEQADLNTAGAELSARNEALRQELDPLKEKVELLEQAEAECPLCGQPLDQDNRARLLEQFRAEGKAKADLFRDNKAELARMDRRKKQLADEIAALDRELKRREAVQQLFANLNAQKAAALEAQEAVVALRTELAAVQARLAAGEFALEDRQQLAALDRESEALGYDPAIHKQVHDECAHYRPFEERKRDLDIALAQLEGERQHVTDLDEQIRLKSAAIEADRRKAASLQTEADKLKGTLAGTEQLAQRTDQLRQAEHEARTRLGVAQQKLDACDYKARQREQYEAEQARLQQEKAIYEELRLAFGKKGVPAMIIEAAIPEIEKTSNELLSRMTNGRMHVRFDTQRETVKGETVETLDIKISDELGTRDYHMYSGGESFRVNFAIRVALSQLLARRAGAQLQTLIIDEGFGALDATGRDQLVEAINAVQKDFARIIVITHLDELKDAFPARIDVTKLPGGSRLAVL